MIGLPSDRARARPARNKGTGGATSLPESQGTEADGQKAQRLDGSGLIATIVSQRKFTLSIIFGTAGVVALFIDKLTGDQFNFLVGIILSIFGAANVAEKKVK